MSLRSHYHSYLLRLWQVADGRRSSWRASLEMPGTGERRGFGSLDALFAYLQEQTALNPPDQNGDIQIIPDRKGESS
jgi:hypothetical protein